MLVMAQPVSWRSSRTRSAVLCACLSLAGQGPLRPVDSGRPDPENLTPPGRPRIVDGRTFHGYDWLQFNLDSQRTGQNNLEWRISRGNVSS